MVYQSHRNDLERCDEITQVSHSPQLNMMTQTPSKLNVVLRKIADPCRESLQYLAILDLSHRQVWPSRHRGRVWVTLRSLLSKALLHRAFSGQTRHNRTECQQN